MSPINYYYFNFCLEMFFCVCSFRLFFFCFVLLSFSFETKMNHAHINSYKIENLSIVMSLAYQKTHTHVENLPLRLHAQAECIKTPFRNSTI